MRDTCGPDMPMPVSCVMKSFALTMGAPPLGWQAAIQGAALQGPHIFDGLEAVHADGRISQWELEMYPRTLGQTESSLVEPPKG